MRGEIYQPLLELVKKAKDWAIYHSIADLSPEERLRKIEEVFLRAVSFNDDVTSRLLLGWLLHAIDDREFLPLLEEEWGYLTLPYNPAASDARKSVQATRAGKLMELYTKLPYIPVEPYFLETKKAILTEVAKWWKEAENEEKSDRAFQFLKSVLDARGFGEHEEEKMQNEVFRVATDRSFPLPRLVRCFLLLVPTGKPREINRKYESTARILAIAIARNTDLERISLLLRANQPVWGSSEETFGLLVHLASDVAVLDQSAGELKKSMQPADHEIRAALEKEGYKTIPGDIKIIPTQLNQIDVLISVQWYRNWSHFDQNKGHEIFEDAKKHILKWKKEHPSIKVRLALTIISENSWIKEPFFVREQTFISVS